MTFSLGGIQVWIPQFLYSERALLAGGGELYVRHYRRRGRHCGVAGGRLAGRLPAAADEGLLLLCFGGQHGAWSSGHDCRSVSCRTRHAAGDCGGRLLSAAEYFATECGGDQLGWRPYSRHCHRSEHFHHSHSGRRPLADYDGMGSRSAVAAGRICSAGDRHGCLFVILFYGMRFAPPLRVQDASAASEVPSGASS